MSATPYLTDEEISDICQPLRMASAQRRHLASLGLLVKEKPNGKPLVARSEFERVLGAGRYTDKPSNDPHAAPNVVGFLQHLSQRKK